MRNLFIGVIIVLALVLLGFGPPARTLKAMPTTMHIARLAGRPTAFSHTGIV